jgi:hypothetical protein
MHRKNIKYQISKATIMLPAQVGTDRNTAMIKLEIYISNFTRSWPFTAKEVKNILDYTNENPADILIPDYQNGKNCCFDVTVVLPFTHPQESATTAGFAMDLWKDENAKNIKQDALKRTT